MATVTFPTELGGNGQTYSDDRDPVTGLRGGGYRTLMVPMLGQAVAMAASVQQAAQAVFSFPELSATSATSNSVALGSKTFAIQTGKAFLVGQFVLVTSVADPTDYMIGQVTAHNDVTGSITINVTAINGSGTTASWVLSVTGQPSFQTQVQEFTSSGTWTRPSVGTFVMVECWGAGGGGASGARDASGTVRKGGAGGGGGAYMVDVFVRSQLPSSASVSVGAGGVGGAAITTNTTAGNAGSSGGDTSFIGGIANVVAYGGGGAGAVALGSGSASVGGGGGGTLSAGSGSQGGLPLSGAFGGANAESTGSVGQPSGYGGGAGAGSNTTGVSSQQGSGSVYGGGGGGGGASISSASANSGGIVGGAKGFASGGGGSGGGVGSVGGNGSNYQGGGGGGISSRGGNGGRAGGGGGGGGATNGSNSGAGGTGGGGFCRVTTF